MKKKKLVIMVLGVLLAGVLSGCSGASADETTYSKIMEKGEMTFAMTGAYPPFNYIGENGALAGFDIEIANAIAAKMGVTAKPITVKPTDTVEQAALIMLDNKVGGLPVVDDAGKLVGIISDHDVFKAMVDITGARLGGLQFAVELPDQPGTARPLFDLLRAHNARILSVLTVSNPDGNRHMFVRVRDLENAQSEQELIAGVNKLGKVLYCQH